MTSSPSSPSPPPDLPVAASPSSELLACPACNAAATGKFCSNCGGPLAGASCAACSAPLTPGSKFCHRCGTPAHAGAAAPGDWRAPSTLPWAVAAIALLALVALVAGQWFGRTGGPAPETGAGAGAGPVASTAGGAQPPDISNLSPAEAAVQLYNRVMGAHERGREDSVRFFAPMAITAYQMIGTLDLDQRYDVGRIAAISGDEAVARAEADTILARSPNHLLGLILAANAAHMRKDAAAERAYRDKLVAAAPAERAKQLPEYITHENDIIVALDAKRP